jgi:hypothetical protein
MVGMNPELPVGNEKAKQLIGRIAGNVGREKGVSAGGKIMEGSVMANIWPPNIIDEAIKRSGLH